MYARCHSQVRSSRRVDDTDRVERFPAAHECSAQNTFVMETLINELAMRAKIEPIAYRLKLLATNAESFALR